MTTYGNIHRAEMTAAVFTIGFAATDSSNTIGIDPWDIFHTLRFWALHQIFTDNGAQKRGRTH